MLMENCNFNGEIRDNVSYVDFSKVMKSFTYAPLFEEWSSQKMLKEYESTRNKKDSFIFGYYLENGECVAVATIRPFTPGEHPVDYPEGSKTMYLSDVATLPAYRNHGIATELCDTCIKQAKEMKYSRIYLTTIEKKSSMFYNIAKRCGFKTISDLCQEVNVPRTRPYANTNKLYIFMSKEL